MYSVQKDIKDKSLRLFCSITNLFNRFLALSPPEPEQLSSSSPPGQSGYPSHLYSLEIFGDPPEQTKISPDFVSALHGIAQADNFHENWLTEATTRITII